MGDSTFFHSGIPPLINVVHHKHDVVITVLDNRTTAMTGHQPHPGTDFDGMGRSAKRILVEDPYKRKVLSQISQGFAHFPIQHVGCFNHQCIRNLQAVELHVILRSQI